MASKTIEERVTIQLAVGRYLRAKDAFEQASIAFNEACQAMRAAAAKPDQYVANVSHKYYLVNVAENGDFVIDEVDCL